MQAAVSSTSSREKFLKSGTGGSPHVWRAKVKYLAVEGNMALVVGPK